MIPEEPMERNHHDRIPRESGDDPPSPHTPQPPKTVFPARAGMILVLVFPVLGSMSIPRESGDDP